MAISYQDNIERSGFQHPGELSTPIRNGQFLVKIIPDKRDSCAGTLFVIVIIVLVLIEREFAIGARVDPQFNRIGRFFGRILEERPHRDNGTRFYQQRNFVNRGVGGYCGVPGKCPSRPEIVPDSSRGKVDLSHFFFVLLQPFCGKDPGRFPEETHFRGPRGSVLCFKYKVILFTFFQVHRHRILLNA